MQCGWCAFYVNDLMSAVLFENISQSGRHKQQQIFKVSGTSFSYLLSSATLSAYHRLINVTFHTYSSYDTFQAQKHFSPVNKDLHRFVSEVASES